MAKDSLGKVNRLPKWGKPAVFSMLVLAIVVPILWKYGRLSKRLADLDFAELEKEKGGESFGEKYKCWSIVNNKKQNSKIKNYQKLI